MRCSATAIMPSGLYRCTYETSERHDEHYFAYARRLTAEEQAQHFPDDHEYEDPPVNDWNAPEARGLDED